MYFYIMNNCSNLLHLVRLWPTTNKNCDVDGGNNCGGVWWPHQKIYYDVCPYAGDWWEKTKK